MDGLVDRRQWPGHPADQRAPPMWMARLREDVAAIQARIADLKANLNRLAMERQAASAGRPEKARLALW